MRPRARQSPHQVSRRAPPPSTSATKTSAAPSFDDVHATRVPSGDSRGVPTGTSSAGASETGDLEVEVLPLDEVAVPGPVTLLGLGQDRDGSLSFIAAEGTVVPGPLLAIGNTTSRVAFGRDPGEWVDEWSATGVGHHWSLSLDHRAADYRAAASLRGIDFRQV